MALSPAAKSVLSALRRKGGERDVSRQARDYHGRWTKGGGGARPSTSPAPAVHIGQDFEELYNKMVLEGKSKAQIIAAAKAAGIENPELKFRLLQRRIRTGKKRAGTWEGKGKKPEVKAPEVKAPEVKAPDVTKMPKEPDWEKVAQNAFKNEGYSGGWYMDAEYQMVAALRKWEEHVLARAVQHHGMPIPENMVAIRFGKSTTLHYVVNDTAGLSTRTAAARILLQRASGKMPPELTRGTEAIFLSSQVNKDDKWHGDRLGIDNFTSAATGGGATQAVVFYRAGVTLRRPYDTLVHEFGHNIANYVYGGNDPSPKSKFYKLWQEWKVNKSDPNWHNAPPSRYGQKDIAEALAEATRIYYTGSVEYGDKALTREYREAVEEMMAEAKRMRKSKLWAHSRLKRRRR